LSNCMYCFRQDVLEERESIKREQKLESQLEALVAYLLEHPELEEVILSGGDPMMLPAEQLQHILKTLTQKTLIRHFRLHTKTIVFDPRSFSIKHQEVLEQYRVRVVFHIVHPYEICSEVEQKIAECRKRGIRLYNHFPILRHINDHVDVLIENVKACDELGINTLSIYFPDPVQYSSAYRISFQRLFSITKDFNHNTPSWINATRFCQDTVHGKVRPDDLIEYEPLKGYALFEREGQIIKVPDHPIHLDQAGDLDAMLWKTRIKGVLH
jgi:L-lysine 2,3-aminomutase